MVYDYTNDMKELVGKKIIRLAVEPAEEILVFFTEDEYFVYETDSDCCSETWFADIIGVENLLGHTVSVTEKVDLPDIQDDRTRQEQDQFYGIKLTTDAGIVDIVYRNSSNGYYGGLINYKLTTEVPSALSDITQDWSA